MYKYICIYLYFYLILYIYIGTIDQPSLLDTLSAFTLETNPHSDDTPTSIYPTGTLSANITNDNTNINSSFNKNNLQINTGSPTSRRGSGPENRIGTPRGRRGSRGQSPLSGITPQYAAQRIGFEDKGSPSSSRGQTPNSRGTSPSSRGSENDTSRRGSENGNPQMFNPEMLQLLNGSITQALSSMGRDVNPQDMIQMGLGIGMALMQGGGLQGMGKQKNPKKIKESSPPGMFPMLSEQVSRYALGLIVLTY
jgi:hypothetical protein